MLESQHLPGLAVVVVHDGQTIYRGGFGFADVHQKRVIDPQTTIFRIGSISKALTLLTLARQIDRGLLARDQDVRKWIDAFTGEIRTPLTIDHLLTHTSGLDQIGTKRQIRHLHLPFGDRRSLRRGIEKFLRDNNLRQIEQPGRRYCYDTYGTTLAGFILGRLHEMPYASVMQQELFEVLGMQDSAVEVIDEKRKHLAIGYGYVDGDFIARPYELYETTPASSIDATPADMGRLMEALTSDGANRSGRFLSAKMHAKVISRHFRVHPSFSGVTHGLFESWSSEDGTSDVHLRSLGHGGSMDGYRAALTLIPSERIGIFIVSNRSPDAGGGMIDFRPLVDVVVNSIEEAPRRMPISIPPTNGANLQQYVGDYYYSVFCHSLTAQDQGDGAWLRGRVNPVRVENSALRVRDELYFPTEEPDLFVQSNGRRMLLFSRDRTGRIDSYTYST
ncbi:MAG: serine hydrolase domain-containing protein, partial [Planctomycetota bacterium]